MIKLKCYILNHFFSLLAFTVIVLNVLVSCSDLEKKSGASLRTGRERILMNDNWSFFLYQSRWSPDFPTAHILPHWKWPKRIAQLTPVPVFNSADEVELFIMAKSKGLEETMIKIKSN